MAPKKSSSSYSFPWKSARKKRPGVHSKNNHSNSKGCKTCGKDGYKGRAGIYELLIPNEAINEAVKNEASAEEVGRIAAENKMKTLQQAALNYVLRGDTSVEEINRVL